MFPICVPLAILYLFIKLKVPSLARRLINDAWLREARAVICSGS